MDTREQLLSTAQSFLLAPHDLETGKLEGVFGSLLKHRLDYADLYFQYARSEGWSLEEGIVKSGSFSIDQGVGVRAIAGEKTAFAYSDEISLPALEDAARATRAIAAAGVLYVIASGSASFDVHAGFASNGYGANSPGGYNLLAGFVAEVVLTAFFLIVIMGATDNRAPKGFAPIAIGLCLTLIHLVGIPVTNVSVNPARSTGPAIFAGGWALQQLWMFWVAPLIGGALGGGLYKALFGE